MAGDYQLTTIAQRLGHALALLNPVRLVSMVRRARAELGTPPPGDPDTLRAQAEAFRAAATAIEPVQNEIRRLTTAGPWHGVAATSAEQVVAAAGTAIGVAPPGFRAAATAL